MSLFNKLEGDTVMLLQSGVYKPSELYEWGGALFAKAAGGYVRLRVNGTTSKDGVSLQHMETDKSLFSDKFGRLTLEKSGNKPIALGGDGKLQIEGR